MQNSVEIINEIFNLYEKYGDISYGNEDISLKNHMIQTAMAAEENKEDFDFIIACFLHHIGYLLKNSTDIDNCDETFLNKLGVNYLHSKGFSNKITAMIEKCLTAKIYLVSRFTSMFTEDIVKNYKLMTQNEITDFENFLYFEEAIRMRIYSEMAKVEDSLNKPISYYKNLLTYFMMISS